ncbi:ribosome-associated translation inhibitor RaiA [Candidatus Saccharibacteria bacterium]|nr:ribosome-associated translation inhibitor RaiA [Candidatus Saccharibacteria bacterium]MBR0482500.1 ribosome-associated translation inhibitor RaiA [Candidatus Saccharibacteria bacterium]
MIEKIDISGSNFKVEEGFKKYVEKRIGKLDRYLPRQHRKDVVAKVVVTQVDRDHGNKYEISASMNIPGGKVLAAKDEASNIFAGIDIIEAKLTGQIRRYKTENTNYDKKGFLKRILKK